MSRWNLCWLLGITAAAALGISITYSSPPKESKKYQNIKLLADVLEEVQRKYAKPLDQDKMRELVENMINGGLEKLDPYSGFMGKDSYKAFRQGSQGKFGGIGILLGYDQRSGLYMVESPLAGTPAYEAGIMAGDYLLKVDGQAIDSWAMRKVVDTIQGDPGTEVTLTILHQDAKKPVDIKLKRAEIKIESVMGDKRTIDLKEWDFWVDPNSKIAYVRVNAFTETTVEELTRVVDGLEKAGLQGLIVDLRTNPGGLLKAAAEVSSLFLPEGKRIVSTKGRGEEEQDVYNAKLKNGRKPGTTYPMVILLNRYSASASEIVAAALQDHARAVIIGERSFGKGSVQNLIEMEDGKTALKLTTASYWRPSRRNIHRFPDSKEEDDWGVKPDKGFEVKLSIEEQVEYFKWRRERDILRQPGQKAKPPDNDKAAFRDRVMDKAVEYLLTELMKKKDNRGAQMAPEGPPRTDGAIVPSDPAPASVTAQDRRVADTGQRSYRNIER